MTQRFILFSFFLFSFLSLFSQSEKVLVMATVEGEKSIRLSEIISVKYLDNVMTINSADGSYSSNDIDLIDKIYFSNVTENATTGIDAVACESLVVSADDVIYLNACAGTHFGVYTTSGIAVCDGIVENSPLRLDIKAWEKGCYIVRMSNRIVKIFNR